MTYNSILDEKIKYINSFEAVFFDMDGTLVETKLFPLEVCRLGDIYLNMRPLNTTIEVMRKVNIKKYILSVSPSKKADNCKRKWLMENYRDMKLENAFFIREDKPGYMKYLSKKMHIDNSRMLLIDDQNIILQEVQDNKFAAMQMSELIY